MTCLSDIPLERFSFFCAWLHGLNFEGYLNLMMDFLILGFDGSVCVWLLKRGASGR